MLGAVTRVNHPLAAIRVGDHSAELIICKSICVTAPGRGVTTTVAAATTVPAPAVEPRSRLRFKSQKTREALEGKVQQFTVNMKEAKVLSTSKKAIAVFKPVLMDFQ